MFLVLPLLLSLTSFSSLIATETEPELKIQEDLIEKVDETPSSTSDHWPHTFWPSFWHPSDFGFPFRHHQRHNPLTFSPFSLHFPSIHFPSSDLLSSAGISKSSTDLMSFNAPMDIKENDKGYDVSIELPGIKKEEISVTVKGNVMTITGERKSEERKDGEKYHRVERYYGQTSRSFTLPPHTNKDDVKASYVDGVLHLNIPKKDGSCSDEIKVNIL